MQNEQILGTQSIPKLLLKYSVPAIIGMMVNALYNVVDRIFIGNIPGAGPLAITGVGICLPIMTIILAFSMLVGIGATTNISIKLGQGKRDEAEKIIGNSITLAIVIGFIITILGILFCEPILRVFGASDSTLPYAKDFIYIILGGTIFSMLGYTLNTTIRGDGNPKLSAIIMIVGCLTNIILDAVLIFVFHLGIKGAAIATVIAQLVTAVWGLSYYAKGKSNLKFKKSSLRLDKNLVKPVFAIGSAPFAMQLATSLVQVISNNALKTYGGDLAIGAMATVSSIALMISMPIFGLNQGAQPIIGFNFGAAKYDRANKAFKLSAIVAVIIMTTGWLLIQTVPQLIVGMFNRDPKLMEMSVTGAKIYLLMLPIIGVSITGSNYIQSIGKAKTAIILSLLRQVIILIPMILILPKFLGLDGVWYAQPVSDFLATVITIIILYREFKSQQKVNREEQEVIA
ncbi:MATE family efflux transporter [Paraclostridium sordellii]|uniref:MATE family efflux transporter n=1 Tax=Paraclostridium sordellii TaxID=1505 RepID=UPI0005DD40C3|nr:MATE family efflux transporter [Paeniclostridium sordellii]CEO09566.1 drug/sodium antiporter [[Clostridium] sordellii] [Paeniclostridium sordellii]CEO25113.1 drug/sodium antiporter [[Clostridium] sordellii] [Paeniclostridium sordellii]CEP87582.1 drug/sodium antiporter [[Clostridium] sordellii] [Paeniclostridium sordellii]CEP95918.1 drug/sodium antiporter [[Clostridium] sordellii] [Paeniclostridium sordellii]CEP98738.1 drug/sodium antiporter [[Clostridium] sordellii] [Paeniclostridium sordel